MSVIQLVAQAELVKEDLSSNPTEHIFGRDDEP